MSEPPSVRASDAERERAIQRVRDAAGEGRLTLEELADRIEAAADASTRADLERLTADLPAAPAPAPEVAVPARAGSVFGDLKRSGRWQVAAALRFETVFGDVVLDLREALVPERETTIDARTLFGDVDVLVPEGVAVEVRSWTFFGDVRQSAGASAPPGAPLVVLTGGTVFGDVKVRAQRTRERLAGWLLGT